MIPTTEAPPINDAERALIQDGLKAFNLRHMPPSEREPIELVARDEAGQVVGGLLAETRWHWLLIHTLWIEDAHRAQGHGARLLDDAEALARSRGCRFAALDTAGFQAADFYRQRGYETFGRLDDYPPGSFTLYLRKSLLV